MTRSTQTLAVFVCLMLVAVLLLMLAQGDESGDVRSRVVYEMAANLDGMLGGTGLAGVTIEPAHVRLLLRGSAILSLALGLWGLRRWRRTHSDNKRS